MRNVIPCITLMMATVATMPAHAGWYVYEHNTHDALTWHDTDGHILELDSGKGVGISVTKVAPAALWGLQSGDVILAIGDHAVQHVDELFDRLNASRPHAVQVHLRRGATEQSLTITSSDYERILTPHP